MPPRASAAVLSRDAQGVEADAEGACQAHDAVLRVDRLASGIGSARNALSVRTRFADPQQGKALPSGRSTRYHEPLSDAEVPSRVHLGKSDSTTMRRYP